jgi:hypothetical protein
MIRTVRERKIEYGDFQTPLDLAEQVCQKLIELGVNPNVIVEPTCGVGNFIDAATRSFPLTDKIVGVEINQQYLEKLRSEEKLIKNTKIEVKQGDFFNFDWVSLLSQLTGNILVIGNFPWVTNSRQGSIGGKNLPIKNNFQNYTGLEAIAGKSNFDISEWMLIQVIHWLQNRDAYLAMLCKSSVSRKLLSYLHSKKLNLAYCATYKIDAKKYFDANVEACLLFCKFDESSQNYFCHVYNSLETLDCYRIGYKNDIFVRDIVSFETVSEFYGNNAQLKWRSGIKHDCSYVMEFHKVDNVFVNGLGEVVDIEDTYLFPLLKGSDVAQNRTNTISKYVLVTQKRIGETTEPIRDLAPKTWNYLQSHAKYLNNRKSKIYQNNPQFSIFGVGSYTFAPWKIAICGLYKRLDFRLISDRNGKPVVFDDTVYFLSFDDENIAYKNFKVLTSPSAINFYSSLIFWDEKRPIKSSILNSLNLTKLADLQA